MSTWGRLHAWFEFAEPLDQWFQTNLLETALQGSEGGPELSQHERHTTVQGRLRDVHDYDSPAVLAWFARVCHCYPFPVKAQLTWELDCGGDAHEDGPRYRYAWDGTTLSRVRGLLD